MTIAVHANHFGAATQFDVRRVHDPMCQIARHALAKIIATDEQENLARILDVNETFSRDRSGNWLSILQLNSDEERFFRTHAAADAELVVRFYLADPENPTSILGAVTNARENARTLRPLVSNT